MDVLRHVADLDQDTHTFSMGAYVAYGNCPGCTQSMIQGMSMRRITITMPPEVLAVAEAQAQWRGMSVSAWLSQAAEHAARLAEGSAAAVQVFAEMGPPNEAELAEARAVLERAARRAAAGNDSSTAA